MEGAEIFYLVILGILALAAYSAPIIIAMNREHAYAGIITVLTVLGGWTGICWLIALVWAIWPSEKSLVDPILGNITGTGERNVGDTFGAISHGMDRGESKEAGLSEELEELRNLLQSGEIDEDDFRLLKKAALKRRTL